MRLLGLHFGIAASRLIETRLKFASATRRPKRGRDAIEGRNVIAVLARERWADEYGLFHDCTASRASARRQSRSRRRVRNRTFTAGCSAIAARATARSAFAVGFLTPKVRYVLARSSSMSAAGQNAA